MATSCQPRLPLGGCLGRSSRLPAKSVRSMPPTKASSSSTITSFSWWQCSGRSCVSSAHTTALSLQSASRVLRTARRDTGYIGNGAPPHSSTRTGTRRAASARRSCRITGGSSAVSAKSGVTHQPAMWTCERAPAIASAMRGSASPPSTSTSIALPVLGGSPASAQPASEAESACSHPTLRRRRRWCAVIARSIESPTTQSTRSSSPGIITRP